jgi:predicted DNA-binding transcriptional regulator AlpA
VSDREKKRRADQRAQSLRENEEDRKRTAQQRLLTFHDLRAKGISFSLGHLRKMVFREEFPPPIKLSPRKSVWAESVVDAWVRSKIEGGAAS